jgi:large repetitive protein
MHTTSQAAPTGAAVPTHGKRRAGLAALALFCALALPFTAQPAGASPVAGSVVENIARANYFDTDRGFAGALNSNPVAATVQVREATSLVADLRLTRPAGSVVNLAHTLTNNGNAPTAVVLRWGHVPVGASIGTGGPTSNPNADTSLTDARLVLDLNGNGVADSGEPVLASGTTLPPLAPGASLGLVLQATVPANARVGQQAGLWLQATNVTAANPSGAGSVSAGVQDSVVVGLGAAVQLSKAANNANPTPGDVLRFALTLSSLGTQAAGPVPVWVDGQTVNAVLLQDTVPAGTRLVALDSSISGNTAQLGVQTWVHVQGKPAGQWQSALPSDPVTLATVDAVAYGWLQGLEPGVSITRGFSVQVQSNATGEINNTATVLFSDNGAAGTAQQQPSNTVRLALPVRAPKLRLYADPGYGQLASSLAASNAIYVAMDAASCNFDPLVRETLAMTVGSALAGDSENFTATETEPNSGVFHIEPSVPTQDATTGTMKRGDGVVAVMPNDRVTVSVAGCGAALLQAEVTFDPFGVLFDSKTNQPVAGAQVTLLQISAAAGAGQVGSAKALAAASRDAKSQGQAQAQAQAKPLATKFVPATVITGADGRYHFYGVPAGQYQLQVVPPGKYSFPSTLAGSLLPPARHVEAVVSYGVMFSVSEDAASVSVDVPLDVADTGAFFIEKTAAVATVEVGDVLDYRVKVTNLTGQLLGQIHLADTLPPGFAYERNSASLGTPGQRQRRLDGSVLPEPDGGAGPQLVFHVGSLDDTRSLTLSYRVRVGAGALSAALQKSGANAATNRAVATSYGPITKVSNTSYATVRVLPGVFDNRSYVVGQVWADCNANRQREATELGIAGVRLFLEDGTSVVTDSQGRYSLQGLRPTTHVLKLDATSLPFVWDALARQASATDQRQGGDATSRFVDLKNGELHRADFALQACDEAQLLATAQRNRVHDRLHERSTERSHDAAHFSSHDAAYEGSPDEVQRGTAPPVTAPVQTVLSEAALVALDAQPAVLFPQAGQTLPRTQTTIQIKGPLHSVLVLQVNGIPVPDSQLGQRLDIAQTQVQVQQWVGVPLRTGANTITLSVAHKPGSGVPADTPFFAPTTITVTAPGPLARLRLTLPELAKPGQAATDSTQRVLLELTDVAGVPITDRTPITLQTSAGQWLVPDLDPQQPGVQIFVTGGRQWLQLQAPATAGPAQLVALSGDLRGSASLAFVPALRPLLAVGVLDGVLSLRKAPASTAAAPHSAAQNHFEDELRALTADTTDARGGLTGRAALFVKGTIAGDTLLTVAYDSDKRGQAGGNSGVDSAGNTATGNTAVNTAVSTALFRESRPSGTTHEARPSNYSIYGDTSTTAFDAASTGRLYLKAERGQSYVLLGDLQTQALFAPGFAQGTTPAAQSADGAYGLNTGNAIEAHRLGLYSRSLTGLQTRSVGERVSFTSFASRTRSRQAVVELASLGTSGPYLLPRAPLLDNSEQVQVITRDRNTLGSGLAATSGTTLGRVLRTQTLTRWVDYQLDALTGRLVLTAPLLAMDADLNPQSLHVRYETPDNNPGTWVLGLAGQLRLLEPRSVDARSVDAGSVDTKQTTAAVLSASAVQDHNPLQPLQVASVALQLGGAGSATPKSSLVVEVARSEGSGAVQQDITSQIDAKQRGYAARIELRHSDEQATLQAQYVKTTAGFNNPSAAALPSATPGQGAEQGSADLTAKLGEHTTLKAQALVNSTAASTAASGASAQTQVAGMVGLQHQLGDGLRADVAVRYSSGTTGATAAPLSAASTPAANTTTSPTEAGLSLLLRASAAVAALPGTTAFVEAEQDLREGARHATRVGAEYRLPASLGGGRAYLRHELASTWGSPYESSAQLQRNTTVVGINSNVGAGDTSVFSEYRQREGNTGTQSEAAVGLRQQWQLGQGVSLQAGFERLHALQGSGATSGPASAAQSTAQSTVVTVGLQAQSGSVWQSQGRLELRRALSGDTLLASAGAAWRASPEWTVLTKGLLTQTDSAQQQAQPLRTVDRSLQLGLAYRERDANRWNALLRLEDRLDEVRHLGANADEAGDFASAHRRHSNVLSAHANLQPQPGTQLSGRYAAKWVQDQRVGLASTQTAQLLGLRLTHELAPRWDVGLHGHLWWGTGNSTGNNSGSGAQDTGRSRQSGLGLEVGYLLASNLWLSVGANATGFVDRELASQDRTERGVYLRLRLKFDETAF